MKQKLNKCSSDQHNNLNQFYYILLHTAVWSKGICLMGKFNFRPNCVSILPVLSSGCQTLAIFEMFNVGHLGVIPKSKDLNKI